MNPCAMPLAAEIMNPSIQTIEPKMLLSEVISFLLEHGRSIALVVDGSEENRRLLGIVSEGDCLEYVGNELFYGNPSPPQTAETIMKKHPTCVEPKTDLFSLASIFTSHRFHYLPIVEEGNLVGIVSRHDVLKAIDTYYREWDRTRYRERHPVDTHQIMNHRFIVGN